MTRKHWRAVLGSLALCLSIVASAHATAPLRAQSVQGHGLLHGTADAPTVLLGGPHLAGSATLEADTVYVERTDDWRETVQARRPGEEPVPLYGNSHRNRTTKTYAGTVRLRNLAFTEPNSTLIARPMAAPSTLVFSHNGTYHVGSVAAEVLETSHFVGANATDNRFYYEYNVSDTLALRPTGAARLQLRGNFHLYVWGGTFKVSSGRTTDTYRTGHWTRDHSQGARVYTEDHFVVARLSIYNGTLTFRGALPETAGVFADRIRADPGPHARTSFVNASGALATAGGPVEATGSTLTADGGAYTWQLRDDGVAAIATEPPAEVRGGQAVPVPWTWPDASTVLPFLGVAGLVAVGAALAVGPNAVARWRHRAVAGPVGAGPPPRSWRQRRAAGLRALAVRAERRRWLGLGAWLLGRAAAWDRENPSVWEDYAVLLRDAGRYEAALDAHREVHALCWADAEGQVAANAYQAARTAARADRIKEARHWFRIALRRDRSLLELAEDEPDFGPVLGDAEGLPGGDAAGSG